MSIEIWAKDVCTLAIAQVGKSCGKTNEYSKELDSVNYYNTKKNGYADSCSIFVDDMVYRCVKAKTADNARAVLYEPNTGNAGAGCPQAAGYFKSHGAWYSKMGDAHCGDKIFFKKADGSIYHTGLVVDWDSKGIYTVEGNTNGGKVAKKFYKYGDSKVAGFGRPKYTGWEPESKPVPDTTPADTPDSDDYDIYDIKVRMLHYVKGNVMTGNDVMSVQAIVGEKQDGKYGPDTAEAVKAWQKAHGLEVDGWWGPECYACAFKIGT